MRLRRGMIELCALGQAGVRLRTERCVLLIDPWTEDHPARLRPAPTQEIAEGVDAVLISHEHMDHLDRGFLGVVAAKSPNARVALPRLAAPLLDDVFPADRVIRLDAGDAFAVGMEVQVEAVPAYHALEAHETIRSDRFLGYVIHAGGRVLYHSGDTIVTQGLIAALGERSPDIAFLPVNGRDAFRERDGTVGNMSAREAVRLCAELGIRTLIPIHWDLMAGNTERPSAVLDAAAELGVQIHVLVLAHLEPFFLG